ncbi:mitochondrial fission factor isoform X9 [Manis pentadactyla]|uniref:mitochondrial fission factor isoform X8 n=1 Tax=Manis javanica TaxID=9974 RepID=UPI000813677C|nr:mitochondrial fission factor isoform X8 [Manis javanica]XP_057359470.1 mitochondrial fission factor isoform X9 [Manis pentadactyla]
MSKRTSSDKPLGRVSGAAFPSPTAAEMAEISRIQYEMEYTEGISQRMRVPEKLKVAPPNADLEQELQEGVPNANVIMQVPERIVVAGNNEDITFSRPADLDLIQSTSFKPLALKTPPRVLTLSERPLDFLDLERPSSTPQNEEIRTVGRLKRERSMSDNAVRQNGQLVRTDSMWHRSDSAPRNKISRFQAPISAPEYTVRRQNEIRCERPVLRGGSAASTNPHHDVRHGISNIDTTTEGTSDDMTVVDAASLRRQIIKLNRRLQLLEEENKERAKREMVMYSITVAFWLLNSWLWFRR